LRPIILLLEYHQVSFTSSDACDEAARTPPSRRDYVGAGIEPEIMLLDEANLTDADAVDFWGYPRPGRAY
jgi:hypothetical protein